jgi:ABC-2 type transport system permease protein
MTWAVELARTGLDGTLFSGSADAGLLLAQGGALLGLAALAFAWALRSIRGYQRSL